MVNVRCADTNPKRHAAVAETCTKDGLSKGSHCSVCGEVFVKQETIPKTGHTASKWCFRCKQVFVESQVIPKLEHQYVDYPEGANREATCKNVGVHSQKCKLCGRVESVPIDKVDHVYVNGKCKWCGKDES